jgi:hypothetical protein
VDREVPYLKNQSFAKSDNSSKNREFDTKLNNKTGLFSAIGNKEEAQDKLKGEVKYIQDKKVRKTLKGVSMRNLMDKPNLTNDDPHMPEYLKRKA